MHAVRVPLRGQWHRCLRRRRGGSDRSAAGVDHDPVREERQPGDIVELAVDVVVHARATSQTHVHGTVDGRTVLHATTAHTDRPDGDSVVGEMPAVSPPETGEPFVLPWYM